MNTFQIPGSLIEQLGWLLVHSVWQFALIALVALFLGRAMRNCSAAARYGMLLLALTAMAVAPIVTMQFVAVSELAAATSVEDRSAIIAPSLSSESGRSLDSPVTSELAESVLPVPRVDSDSVGTADGVGPLQFEASALLTWRSMIEGRIRPWLSLIVGIWCSGVFAFALRPVLSGYTVSRLRRVGVSAVPQSVTLVLHQLANRICLRPAVRIMQSTVVKVPVVVGYIRPMILLPVAIISSLPLPQLEAIIAHELAHIRRHDYLVNLLQTLIETVLFYHPVVWWLSRRIRVERENCCDDIAAALCASPIEYGRALLALEELRGPDTALAISANGGSLVERVRRILGHQPTEPSRPMGGLLTLSIVASATVALGLWAGVFSNPRTLQAIDDPLVVSGQPSADRWPQWGGSPARNNVSGATNLPSTWDVSSGQNILWNTKLGTFSFGSPVVASGKVLIGTNNGAERVARFPKSVDLACLQCLNQRTGDLLWQYSSEKLPAGRNVDWPEIGLCSTPCVDGDRVWLTTNRGEVICLDLNGFLDGQNDGPVIDEKSTEPSEADVVWRFDILKELGVTPHFQACSSPTIVGDLVLVNTGNGADETHLNIPAPDAPSFLALNRYTGHVVWQDASPRGNLLGGECPSSSPAVGELGGVVQAIYSGGDGWLYAFDVADMRQGRTQLLWKFDVNEKTATYSLSAQANRNMVISSPVIHGGRVYAATGRNPEHGEGPGLLWCLDPAKRGDISAEQVFNRAQPNQPIPHKRFQACESDKGDFTRPNPNSGVIWKYASADSNGNGKLDFEESLHRTCGSVAIHAGLLMVADLSGIVHCLDATTGQLLWTHDQAAAAWATPLIADGKVYMGDEDGDLSIFRLARKKDLLAEISCQDSIYATPAAVNSVVFVGTKQRLIAVQSRSTTDVTKIGDPTVLLPDHLNVIAVRFDSDDKSLLTAATESKVTLRRWNVEDKSLTRETELETEQHGNLFLSGQLTFSTDLKLVCAMVGSEIGIWDTETGKVVKMLPLPAGIQGHLAWSRDSSLIACGGTNGLGTGFGRGDAVAAILDAAPGEVIQTVTHAAAVQIHCLAFSPDGRWLATGTQQAGTCIWEVGTGKLLHSLPNANPDRTHPDPEVTEIARNQVLSLSFSPDGKQLAIGDLMGVKLVEAATGRLVHSLPVPFRFGRSGFVYSPDGKWLARVATDKTVPIWSTQTGNPLAEIMTEAHAGSFSNDGQWFAAGLSDSQRALAVWRLTGRLSSP